MNIDEQAAAKQLQALFEETNKAVKGNWIAPELADIVKILQDNQKGGDASCSNESKNTSTTSAQSGNAAPTVQAAGAAQREPCPIRDSPIKAGWHTKNTKILAEYVFLVKDDDPPVQPKPEPWQEMELWTHLGREVVRQGCVIFTCDDEADAVHAVELHNPAIERSHAAQPQRSIDLAPQWVLDREQSEQPQRSEQRIATSSQMDKGQREKENRDLSALHKHDAEEFRKGWEAGHKAGAEVRKPLVEALQEALVPIAVLKLTDNEKPYTEISPELRVSLLNAHDMIMSALAKVKEAH